MCDHREVEIPENRRPGQPAAVVVGAGGMAMAAARRLGIGHRLLVADRDPAHLDTQIAALRYEGHDAVGLVTDVTDQRDVERLAEVASGMTPLRSLAHVVGLAPATGPADAILRVNLRGAALVADAFSTVMPAGSAAVFVSSMAAHLGSAPPEVLPLIDDPLEGDLVERVRAVGGELTSSAAYTWSKIGVNRMVRRLAPEWGRRGVRIVSLSPGLILTPMGIAGAASPERRALTDASPFGREGTTIEITDALEFLLSDRASFVSGVDLLVDGALTAAIAQATAPG
jgi:NAD(P)-dependent dehydrogenase (short-subunit alcohol dehydrogenase family)